MPVLVVDASCVAAWALEETQADWLKAVMEQIAWQGAVVPAFWGLEIANAVLSATKSNRLPIKQADIILSNVAELNVTVDRRTHEQAFFKTFAMAKRRNLTPYDAAYLELSLRHEAVLATLDKALAQAARAEGLLVLTA